MHRRWKEIEVFSNLHPSDHSPKPRCWNKRECTLCMQCYGLAEPHFHHVNPTFPLWFLFILFFRRDCKLLIHLNWKLWFLMSLLDLERLTIAHWLTFFIYFERYQPRPDFLSYLDLKQHLYCCVKFFYSNKLVWKLKTIEPR